MPIQYDQQGNVITNIPASEEATAAKYANPGNIVSNLGSGAGSAAFAAMDPRRLDNPLGERTVPGVPTGAIPIAPTKPAVVFQDMGPGANNEDLRVKILVPPKYITTMLAGPNNELANAGGILFPYTPTISYEAKADYSGQQPLHSNFASNFYQKSNIGSISISGQFSVETADDADIYLCTMHLLKSLTRMRFGTDPDAGAPPPVCRLFAHGDMMFNNIPIAISSFRLELPNTVDYFTLKANSVFGTTSVPTMSTFSLTCIPMYSRNEMQKFSVSGYNDGSFKNQGYL
jgi:hypothetical protein